MVGSWLLRWGLGARGGGEFKAEGGGDLDERRELRVPGAAQRAVKALTRKAGFPRQGRHALELTQDAERIGNERGVACCERLRQEESGVFLGLDVVGGIERQRCRGHRIATGLNL